MASRPASASSSSARGKIAKRCASPSVPESRSMADTQQNTEPKKAKKPHVAKDSDAPTLKTPGDRSASVARLKSSLNQAARAELSKQFGYTNRLQVPVITKVVLN